MPSHIYLRSGDYAAAVKSDEDAIAVDKKYLESRAIRNMDYVLGYAEHNLSFLIYAASMSGEYERARAAAKQLEDFGRGALVENSQMRVEAYLSAPLSVELRFAHWDEILRAPEPDAKLHGFEYFWHYARGSAFAVKGDKQKAAVERDAMKRESRQLFGNMFGMLPNDWNTARAIAENALDARFSASNGDAAGAVSHWRAAVAAEDGMAYHEPPDWNYPVRESLGAQLLRSGKASEADSVFRDDLARNPRNPRSLFGLWKALEKEKKMNEAAEARRQFEKVWAGQKVDLRLEDF
jgi:tetratricopeptide (TPR) repeat protein